MPALPYQPRISNKKQVTITPAKQSKLIATPVTESGSVHVSIIAPVTELQHSVIPRPVMPPTRVSHDRDQTMINPILSVAKKTLTNATLENRNHVGAVLGDSRPPSNPTGPLDGGAAQMERSIKATLEKHAAIGYSFKIHIFDIVFFSI